MQLYNLKKMCGTFKGYIGECMFQLSQKGVILPRYFPKDKFFIFFGNYIDEKKKAFIEKNYFSIDGIKIIKSPLKGSKGKNVEYLMLCRKISE